MKWIAQFDSPAYLAESAVIETDTPEQAKEEAVKWLTTRIESADCIESSRVTIDPLVGEWRDYTPPAPLSMILLELFFDNDNWLNLHQIYEPSGRF